MRKNWQIFIGILIILAGLVFLIGAVTDIDAGAICFPIVLIAVGVFLLLRPKMVDPGTGIQLRLLGDVRRRGQWEVKDEEIWVGIGDVRLDMTEADVPLGETRFHVFGFIGDVRLSVPENVGVRVSSMSFITDARVLDQKRETFFAPVHLTSEGYETAERKVHLEMNCFIGEARVRRAS